MLFGIPAILHGDLPGNRCARCGSRSIPGHVIENAANEAVLMILEVNRRLSGIEARFLRKSALRIGEAELARRFGIPTQVVRSWEASMSLAPDRDFALRSLVVGCLLGEADAGRRFNPKDILHAACESLQSTRRRRAPRRPRPLKIAASLAA